MKSILKKADQVAKKKNSHVNYAFETDEEDFRPAFARPKTATVIDKKTGSSKPLLLPAAVKRKAKFQDNHVVLAQVH